uniref:VWFD domain-containing protein n=1 Tax=Neogobius melanostomus TaxID=47308 RepID=A0A8C6TZG8_9GOBI
MKGNTCGMCGRADGEVRQEYRTPNNRVIKDRVTTAAISPPPSDSWCKLQQVSVKLDGSVIDCDQPSKCYSVVPVLRCINGCHPPRTKTIRVGYHCAPQAQLTLKSVDVEVDTVAHEECQCTPQCS